MTRHLPRVQSIVGLAATGLLLAAVAAACGGSKSTATSGPAATTTSANGSSPNGTPGRGFGNRTPPPAIQTSIAEGTPRGPFANGTPPAGIQTAIAEGTRPAGFGAGGSGRTLGPIATLLNIPLEQLQSELGQAGATIASVAAAHGIDRGTVRQAFIDAERQRLADAVASGRIAQSDADAQQTQFEAGVDQLLDGNGIGPGGPGGPPPATAQ